MSEDGATLGINAETALTAVLGGDQPTEEDLHTTEEVRERLSHLPRVQDIEVRQEEKTTKEFGTFTDEVFYVNGLRWELGYGGCADVAARAVLEFLEAHPEHRDAPIDTVFDETMDWDDPEVVANAHEHIARQDLYTVMKGTEWDVTKLGLTGFQWGFAYNTAHWLLGLPEGHNPAIMTIGVETDG